MDPAHAGMILFPDWEIHIQPDGPRACGDDPAVFKAHGRGHSMDPAHAGMILVSIGSSLPLIHGPRACGDDPNNYLGVNSLVKWTPRMRG